MSLKREKRVILTHQQLLANTDDTDLSYHGSSDDPDDIDDDEVEFVRRSNQFKTKIYKALRKAGKRRRSRWQRALGRRLVRLLICAFLVPLTLVLMLYLSLYSSGPSRHFALPDWSFNTSLHVADYVLPDNDTTLLEPRHLCEKKMFLLIIVCSSLDNFAARQAIRRTWGSTSDFNYGMFSQLHEHLQESYLQPKKQRVQFYRPYLNMSSNQTTKIPDVLPVRVVFLMGRSKYESYLGNETLSRVRQEAAQYNDIIQEDFVDTYNNLTLKSVLALKWMTRNKCLQQIAYFMKCDDDTFVNVPNLLHFLLGGTVPLYNDTLDFYDVHSFQTLSPRNRLNVTDNYLAGHLFCTARPVANVTSKWYMPFYMYRPEMYPHYLSGAGYIMSADVVIQLYATALKTNLIYLEDVYITGICAERAHLARVHHPLFSYTHSKKLCTFKGVITQHDMKEDSMYVAYNFVTNTSNHCPPPGKYFKRIRLRKHNSCE